MVRTLNTCRQLYNDALADERSRQNLIDSGNHLMSFRGENPNGFSMKIRQMNWLLTRIVFKKKFILRCFKTS